IRKNVAVRQKKNARTARRLTAQIPATVKQLPRDLKGDEGFAGAGSEREQNALPVVCDSLQHPLDRDVLIISAGMRTAFVLEGNRGETVTPCVWFSECELPKFVRRWITGQVA